MNIGYARVSTIDQNLDLQFDALKNAGCERVFSEKISGKTKDRPELEKCLDHLRKGDCLTVWRLDRLGRSVKDLIQIVSDLEKRGINFKSCSESIDTTSSTGKLIFHIFGAFAEFERNIIQERTKAGLNAARARGRLGGRPKALASKNEEAVKSHLAAGELTYKEIADLFNISISTVYRISKAST